MYGLPLVATIHLIQLAQHGHDFWVGHEDAPVELDICPRRAVVNLHREHVGVLHHVDEACKELPSRLRGPVPDACPLFAHIFSREVPVLDGDGRRVAKAKRDRADDDKEVDLLPDFRKGEPEDDRNVAVQRARGGAQRRARASKVS